MKTHAVLHLLSVATSLLHILVKASFLPCLPTVCAAECLMSVGRPQPNLKFLLDASIWTSLTPTSPSLHPSVRQADDGQRTLSARDHHPVRPYWGRCRMSYCLRMRHLTLPSGCCFVMGDACAAMRGCQTKPAGTAPPLPRLRRAPPQTEDASICDTRLGNVQSLTRFVLRSNVPVSMTCSVRHPQSEHML